MAWTLCLSGPAITKAGANANPTIINYGSSQTELDAFSDEAEGSMELETGKALLDNFSNLATGVQGAIADICSSKIAMKIIVYDTTGYISREADALLNVNDDIITKGMTKLREFTNLTLKKPIA